MKEYIEQEIKKHNYTKDGKCTQCGNCCSTLLPMSDKEISTIRRYIKKHNIKECKHSLPLTNPAFDLTCPFLDTDKQTEKCRIYPVRPQICKSYICGKLPSPDRELLKQTRRVVDMKEEFFRS